MSERDDLLAVIVQWATEAEKRSGSDYVDERQRWIRDAVARLDVLPLDGPAEMFDVLDDGYADLVDRLAALGDDMAIRFGRAFRRYVPRYKNVFGLTFTDVPPGALVVGTTYVVTVQATLSAKGGDYLYPAIWTSTDEAVSDAPSGTDLPTDSGVATCAVTPLTAGTFTLRCRVDGKAVSRAFTVQATPVSAQSVSLSPSGTISALVGGTVTFTAEVRDNSNNVMTGRTINWTVQSGSGSINSGGVLTVSGAGSIVVRGTDNASSLYDEETVTASASLTPTTVEVTPAGPVSLPVGTSITLSAVTKDQDGNPMAGRSHTYGSSDTGKVSLAGNVATFVATGSATITVSDTAGSPTPDTLSCTVTAAVGSGELAPRTGRPGQFLWTPSRMYIWDQMLENDHAFALAVKRAADTWTGTYGWAHAWMYQLTGDVAYAQAGFTQWYAFDGRELNPTTWNAFAGDENKTREYSQIMVLTYDWLYAGLTSTQRQQGAFKLSKWRDAMLKINVPQYTGGIGATNDTDQVCGCYPACVMLHYLDVPEFKDFAYTDPNWGAVTINLYHNVLNQSADTTPVGGLFDAFGGGYTSTGDRFKEMIQQSSRGEHIEGTQYNGGTTALIIGGVEMIRASGTTSGEDLSAAFPEYDDYLQQTALWWPYRFLEDFSSVEQWADEQVPRGIQTGREFVGVAHRAGATQGTAAGPIAAYLANQYWAVHSDDLANYDSQTSAALRAICLWNPYATAASEFEWGTTPSYKVSALPTALYHGTGQVILRRNDGMLLDMRGWNKLPTDHPNHGYSHLRLHDGDEWLFDNPVGYGGAAIKAYGKNAVTLAGLDSFSYEQSQRGLERVETGTSGGDIWLGVTAHCEGPYYRNGYYDPPPTFCRQADRKMVYVRTGGYDCVAIQDVFDLDDPRSLAKYTRYATADRTQIEAAFTLTGGAAKILNFWALPASGAPTFDDAGAYPYYQWTTSGGKTVRLAILSVGGTLGKTATAFASTGWALSGNYSTSERAKNFYSLRLWNASGHTAAETYYLVWLAGTGTVPTITRSGASVTIGAKTINFGGADLAVSG